MPAPGDRSTKIQDLKRLRALADAGVVRAVAARVVGMDQATVRYWDLKAGLGFVIRPPAVRAPAVPPAVLPRLRARPRYDRP